MTETITRFEKSFTQQEPIPEDAIARAVDVMRSGRLHRYNVAPGEEAEVAMLEREYAAWQGARYCLACASGGYALTIAMRAAGVRTGDKVLANAWTLAPVPGAIQSVQADPVFVEIGEDLLIDVDDLDRKAKATGARYLMLSHMRGHIADMDAVLSVCEAHGIVMIEDCAHTMGARWKGTRSGNSGRIACFSTQTYKHINSGEGGLLTTNDADIAARAIIHSGSYMLYALNGARPALDAFDPVRLETPNHSGRMDNLRAAILRPQLAALDDKVRQWNERYQIIESALCGTDAIVTIPRAQHEEYVGSSLQFRLATDDPGRIDGFLDGCAGRGVDIKWFGRAEPQGFTSRYDSWRYFRDVEPLPKTLSVLSTTCDLRIPLTFTPEDARVIGEIICDEAQARLS